MKILLAFDFDHTFIDDDSDDFTLRQLLPPNLQSLVRYHPGTSAALDESPITRSVVANMPSQWTHRMDYLFQVAHQFNAQHPDFDLARELDRMLRDLPFDHTTFKPFLQSLPAEVEVGIVSDANSVFIERFLAQHELDKVIRFVITNPAHFDQQGRLRIRQHASTQTLHTHEHCHTQLCPVNLCKSTQLTRHISSPPNSTAGSSDVRFDRVVYVGDGKNDLCPILALKQADFALVRHGLSLQKFLDSEQGQEFKVRIKARLIYWHHYEDLTLALRQCTNSTAATA